MPQTLTLDREAPARNLFGTPEATELFAAIDDAQAGAGRAALEKIAAKIGRTRRPGAKSDIPAGATYLTQFVVHDLDFPTRDVVPATGMLDLSLIQGDKEVKDGDRLVTAGFTSENGLTSQYPADIPIGEVVETIPAEQEQREQVNVEPFADLADLTEVTVLTTGGGG